MPKLSPAMADAASVSGLLKPGDYVLKLVDVEQRFTPNGNESWSWSYEVIGDPDYKGRVVWDNTVLTDKAAWKLLSIFNAFGVKADTDTDDLIGKQVIGTIDHHDYNGRTFNRITGYKSAK